MSAKGHFWSNHKYVKKIGKRYYYKDDLARGAQKSQLEYLARYNMQKAAEDPDHALYRGNKALQNAIKAKKVAMEQSMYDKGIFKRPLFARIEHKTLNGIASMVDKGQKKIKSNKFNSLMKKTFRKSSKEVI